MHGRTSVRKEGCHHTCSVQINYTFPTLDGDGPGGWRGREKEGSWGRELVSWHMLEFSVTQDIVLSSKLQVNFTLCGLKSECHVNEVFHANTQSIFCGFSR